MPEPLLTLIVPTPPHGGAPRFLPQMEKLSEKFGPIEVIIARGHAPAQQRNQAAAKAAAKILYFIDDDCRVNLEAILCGFSTIRQRGAAAVGGPAITDPSASFLEHCFGDLMASPLGTWRVRSRATPVGVLRRTDGEELIMCNFMIDRTWFEQVGGFDEGLYPGEERDLWRRLAQVRAPLYYVPTMQIHRGRRKSLAGFFFQHFRYGQARGHQLTCRCWKEEGPFLFPSLLVLYLGALAISPRSVPVWPAIIYALLAAATGICSAITSRQPTRGIGTGLFFPLMHAAYGLGMLAGILRWRPPVRPAPEQLEILRYGF